MFPLIFNILYDILLTLILQSIYYSIKLERIHENFSFSSSNSLILIFLLGNDLFPLPVLSSFYAPLLARRVWLLGSSFCRFASLVFILRRCHAIFIPRFSSSSFLPSLLLLLRPSSPVLEDYLRRSYYYTELLSPRNLERNPEQESKSSLIERFASLYTSLSHH